MKNMVSAKNKNIKISSLTICNTGVIVVITKKESFNILFTEIKKVYIKKSKLSFIHKAGIISFLLLVFFNSILFLPIEMVFISMLLYVPILAYIKNYKLYKLHLLQKSNGLYFRNLNRFNKQKYINQVNLIRKELFYIRDNSSITTREVPKSAARIQVADYPMPRLNIV